MLRACSGDGDAGTDQERPGDTEVVVHTRVAASDEARGTGVPSSGTSQDGSDRGGAQEGCEAAEMDAQQDEEEEMTCPRRLTGRALRRYPEECGFESRRGSL